MKYKYSLSLFLFFFIFINAGAQAQLPKIIFMPHWLPQAQFAGYYVAQQKGFYQQEGIEVDIVHPSASVEGSDYLIKGKVDVISFFLVSALNEVDKGTKMVNIAQMSQNSALLFVAKKEKNYKSLNDLNGKKIGIWESGFDELPKSLLKKNNIGVKWVPILSSISMFMLDGIDAMTVMWYNEYDQIINAGFNPDELTTFFFSKYGYNIPEDGLYCLNNSYLTRKEDLQKFVRGTLRGWEYAEAHPEEALKIVLAVMKKEHISTNYVHQKWMLEKVLELMVPSSPNGKKGVLSEPDFIKAQNALFDGGFVIKKIPYKDFYKPVL
jgi:NitT/TauT family transport system substrate-binding protein